MGEVANINQIRDPQLYLLQSLEPESLLQRLLGLCEGFVGAALRTPDLPGWQVGQRTNQHEHLSILWDGETVAELILYANTPKRLPGNLMPTASLAIAHTVRLARAEYAAYTDALTGLANRRALEPHLDKTTHQAALILDLDFFKQVNDQFGHDAGDQLLRRAAKRLKAGLRAGDQAYRLGGEEFLVVMQLDQVDDLAAAAERIRQKLCGAIQVDHEWIRFTCSAGLATGQMELSELIRHADRALYRAKHAGRNQTAIFVA